MIARHEVQLDRVDLLSALAAPLPAGVISWRHYAYEQNWVQLDGGANAAGSTPTSRVAGEANAFEANRKSDEPACPQCSGRMWDNRLTKRNPKAPDYKCRDRSCEGVIWPAKSERADEVESSAAVEDDVRDAIPF